MAVKLILVLSILTLVYSSLLIVDLEDVSFEDSLSTELAEPEILEQSYDEDFGQRFRFSLGKRRHGDRVVLNKHSKKHYKSYRDVNVTLRYPSFGSGKLVTCVQIFFNETSKRGNATIVRGGINKRFIKVLLRGFRTNVMDYNVTFYAI